MKHTHIYTQAVHATKLFFHTVISRENDVNRLNTQPKTTFIRPGLVNESCISATYFNIHTELHNIILIFQYQRKHGNITVGFINQQNVMENSHAFPHLQDLYVGALVCNICYFFAFVTKIWNSFNAEFLQDTHVHI